jgi:hypothetical protein
MEQSREDPVFKPSISIPDTDGTIEIMMPAPKGMGTFDLKIGESLISLNMNQGAKVRTSFSIRKWQDAH